MPGLEISIITAKFKTKAEEPQISRFFSKLLEVNGGTVPCEVRVFPMIVKRQLDAWPEAHEREARWFDSTKALSVTREKSLHQLIESFVQRVIARRPHG
jgi:hypothetical protein